MLDAPSCHTSVNFSELKSTKISSTAYSQPWEIIGPSAPQDITCILWVVKAQCADRKSPLLTPIAYKLKHLAESRQELMVQFGDAQPGNKISYMYKPVKDITQIYYQSVDCSFLLTF